MPLHRRTSKHRSSNAGHSIQSSHSCKASCSTTTEYRSLTYILLSPRAGACSITALCLALYVCCICTSSSGHGCLASLCMGAALNWHSLIKSEQKQQIRLTGELY